MKLENQVTSLELSKRLAELGVKQESLFYWFKARITRDQPTIQYVYHLKNSSFSYFENEHYETCSAFTAAELINILREYIKYDIYIPCKVDICDFLGGKLIGLLEETKKKN